MFDRVKHREFSSQQSFYIDKKNQNLKNFGFQLAKPKEVKTMSENKPIEQIRVGSINIAIWEKEKDGKLETTASLQKTWLKKDGDAKKPEDWEKSGTINLFEKEIRDLFLAVVKLYNKRG